MSRHARSRSAVGASCSRFGTPSVVCVYCSGHAIITANVSGCQRPGNAEPHIVQSDTGGIAASVGGADNIGIDVP